MYCGSSSGCSERCSDSCRRSKADIARLALRRDRPHLSDVHIGQFEYESWLGSLFGGCERRYLAAKSVWLTAGSLGVKKEGSHGKRCNGGNSIVNSPLRAQKQRCPSCCQHPGPLFGDREHKQPISTREIAVLPI